MAQGKQQPTFWPILALLIAGACTPGQEASSGGSEPQGTTSGGSQQNTDPLGQNGNAVQPNATLPGPTQPNSTEPNGLPVNTNNTVVSPNVVVPLPQGANVRFIGRTDTVTDAAGPMLSWPGSQIVVGFTGTQLTADLAEVDRATYAGARVNNYFLVTTETGATSRIKLSNTAQSYVVATGLAPGQHQIALTKLTEAQIGRVQWLGAKTDGALTFTTASPNRRLEFIGDSGTAGYGSGGAFPCTFSAATEDASVAYPAVVGALLGAEVNNLSFSGKGLVQNRDMVNDSYKTLPILWQRTLPNDEDERPYNPNGWLPQAVVMTIGGNDFRSQVLSQSVFNAKVIAFIKQVQKLYPGVHVYLGLSPMLRNDSHPTQRESGLAYAQAAVTSMADSHVHYIDIPRDLGANGYGCDQHMTPATHRAVAASIAQVLKVQLGW